MKISTSKKVIAAIATVGLGLGALGFSASAATAAEADVCATGWTPSGLPEAFFPYSLDTGEVIPAGTVIKYDDGVVGAPNPVDPEIPYLAAPDDAFEPRIFISPRGKENVISEWLSVYAGTFMPGTKKVLQSPARLERFDAATFGAVKVAGGEYSLGFAYTKNNGVTLVGLGAYAHVTLTPGTAAWTIDLPECKKVVEEADGSPGDIGVEAPVVAPEPPVDGKFELSIPAGAKATLSGAKLVDGKSTATGVLPTFDVIDERAVSKKGWDATASVTEFARTSGTEKIGADALTIAPKVVADGTTSTGVAAQAGFQGSATAKPFATAAAGTGVGTTKLSADLTFVAPAGSVEGTYTSKVTVTVVSK